MRKEADLLEKDSIVLHISSEKEIESILEKNKDTFIGSVNATKLEFAVDPTMKEFEIDGRLVKISLKKD